MNFNQLEVFTNANVNYSTIMPFTNAALNEILVDMQHKIRAANAGAAPGSYNTTLSLDSSTTGNSDGVTVTTGSTDAQQKFEFNEITVRTGLPCTMTIYVGVDEELVVDFPSDYIAIWFKYTTKANVVKYGLFENGEIEY